MNNPRTSLTVVMKGPVAKAGSMSYLSRTSGTKVPNNVATMMTVNSAALTVKLKPQESLKKML